MTFDKNILVFFYDNHETSVCLTTSFDAFVIII